MQQMGCFKFTDGFEASAGLPAHSASAAPSSYLTLVCFNFNSKNWGFFFKTIFHPFEYLEISISLTYICINKHIEVFFLKSLLVFKLTHLSFWLRLIFLCAMESSFSYHLRPWFQFDGILTRLALWFRWLLVSPFSNFMKLWLLRLVTMVTFVWINVAEVQRVILVSFSFTNVPA